MKSIKFIGKGFPDDVNGFYFMRFRDLYSDCDATTAPTTKQYFYSGFGDAPPNRSSVSGDTAFIQTGKWYTIVYTYDGYESRIYVNGALKNIFVKGTSFTPNSFDVLFGRHDSSEYPYYFNGVIDEIRMYNKPLCMEQVAKLSAATN